MFLLLLFCKPELECRYDANWVDTLRDTLGSLAQIGGIMIAFFAALALFLGIIYFHQWRFEPPARHEYASMGFMFVLYFIAGPAIVVFALFSILEGLILYRFPIVVYWFPIVMLLFLLYYNIISDSLIRTVNVDIRQIGFIIMTMVVFTFALLLTQFIYFQVPVITTLFLLSFSIVSIFASIVHITYEVGRRDAPDPVLPNLTDRNKPIVYIEFDNGNIIDGEVVDVTKNYVIITREGFRQSIRKDKIRRIITRSTTQLTQQHNVPANGQAILNMPIIFIIALGYIITTLALVAFNHCYCNYMYTVKEFVEIWRQIAEKMHVISLRTNIIISAISNYNVSLRLFYFCLGAFIFLLREYISTLIRPRGWRALIPEISCVMTLTSAIFLVLAIVFFLSLS